MTLRRLLSSALAPIAWRSLLALALAIAAFAQLLLPSTLRIAAPAAVPLPPENAVRDRAAPRPEVYAAIAEYPLFEPTRRPYIAPKPPARATPAAVVLRDYTLLGIVIGDGTRIAVLQPPANGKIVFAAEGQAVGGWTLRRITPRLVRFANGAAHYDMRFAGPRWLDR